MITWLQNFFLKHNKWLFGSLLIVIIVTFVLTIGPQSFFGSSSQQRQSIEYYGYDLTSPADQRTLTYSAEISAILHPELRIRREQLMDYAYLRVTALGLANQVGIPAPTTEQLTDFLGELTPFQDPMTGEFSSSEYNRVLNALQTNARYDKDTLGLVLREDYRIRKVSEALSGPAYSLPFELAQDYTDRKTQYNLSLARFNYADFEPEIEAGEDALLAFYNENPARYEIPERIKVQALSFPATAYLGELATPSDDDLQALFSNDSERYQNEWNSRYAEGEEVPPLTLEAIREDVVKDFLMTDAMPLAARKSEAFTVRLWQESIALGSPEYLALLDDFSIEVSDIEPFAREAAPTSGMAPVQALESMWIYANNPRRYFSDVVQVDSGAMVLVTDGTLPARQPAFEEVRDQVEADYRESEKRRLFAEEGSQLLEALNSALADGVDFASAANLAGLTAEEQPAFNGEAIPVLLRRLGVWEQAQFLPEGTVSPMMIQGDQGIFVYMAGKTVPEIDPEDAGYKAFLAENAESAAAFTGLLRLREMTDKSLGSVFDTPIVN
jgi:peptidyl-prolyl cis-trans isomerase D